MGSEGSLPSWVCEEKGSVAGVPTEAGAELFRHKFNGMAVSVPVDMYSRLCRVQNVTSAVASTFTLWSAFSRTSGGQVPLLTGKKSGGERCSLHTGGDGASLGQREHTEG